MKIEFSNVIIKSIASCVPPHVIELRELFKDSSSTEIEKIIKTTGISRIRQVGPSVTSSDLCQRSAQVLLNQEDINTIDGLIFVSQTGDHQLPATSNILQNKLGLGSDTFCLDVPYGCSGYIYGLFLSSLLISSKACSKILVLAGDTTTSMINPKDRAVRMVFGDAGSATLIEQGSGKIYAALQSDGSGAKDLIIPAGGFRMPSSPQTCIASEREPGNFRSDEDLYMDGMSILNFAIREVPKMIDETLNALHWDKSEVGSVVFHQANEFIVNYLAKRLKLSKDQAPIAVEGFGNTGPSSIPLLLSNCGETLSAAGRLNKAILCGFGVGLSWGVIGCDLSKTKFYKPIDY